MSDPNLRNAFEKAVSLYREGQLGLAAMAFKDVLAADKDMWDSRLYLSMCLFKLGRATEAQNEMQYITDFCPDQEMKSRAQKSKQMMTVEIKKPVLKPPVDKQQVDQPQTSMATAQSGVSTTGSFSKKEITDALAASSKQSLAKASTENLKPPAPKDKVSLLARLTGGFKKDAIAKAAAEAGIDVSRPSARTTGQNLKPGERPISENTSMTEDGEELEFIQSDWDDRHKT